MAQRGVSWVAVGVLSWLALGADGCSSNESGIYIGAPYDGGTVVGVDPGNGCSIVTIEHAPEWQCSSEELAASKTGLPSENLVPPAVAGGEGVQLGVSDCESLANLRRPSLKNQQRSALWSRRQSLLSTKCVGTRETKYVNNVTGAQVSSCYSSDRSQQPSYSSGTGTGSSPTVAPPPANVAIEDSSQGATNYSTTNNQVAGVDEADFVKNDANHVYVLSNDGLHVIDAWPAAAAHEVAHLSLPGEPRRLFLYGKRLVVYTRMSSSGSSHANPSSQGCTYGYDCRFSSEGGQTLAIIYDVSDPAKPAEVHRYEFSGGYVASRRVGQRVYTVVNDTGATSAPGVNLTLQADNPTDLEKAYQTQLAAADSAVDSMPAVYFLPWVRELDAGGNVKGDISSCDALSARSSQGASFISLVTFDVSDLEAPARTLVATKPGFVYASAGALYLATDGTDASQSYGHQAAATDTSTIHKFGFVGSATRYAGSASVRGHVLNQFSMDEQGGVLRVATSSGWVPAPDVSSNITTLAEQQGPFAKVGELTGLAPQEDIRAVRFDGDRGFVVTFKKTDPLFVIDLGTPSAPKVLGELKIPGFSTYMHRIDPNHLLAIGFDADDHGSFAYFDGIQIQLFDVTDLTNPKLLHKTIIGTRGSGSEALTNHLAFNYFPSQGLLALPMTICEGGDNGMYGDKLTFSGLMVFDVSLTAGITEHGRMPFVNTASVSQSNGFGGAGTCSQWWSRSTSGVKRSIFMDNYAIGISDDHFDVAALSELSNVLQSLPLAPAPQ